MYKEEGLKFVNRDNFEAALINIRNNTPWYSDITTKK